MTTKLGVLAKVLAVVVLLAAPAAAAQKHKAATHAKRVIKASVTATAPARLRVCRAKRVAEKATPSIEPEWRLEKPVQQLLARR